MYYLSSLSIGFNWERVGEVQAGKTNSIPASLFPANQGFFTSGSKWDADEDGLTDGFELLVAGTSPTNPDSAADLDNDGVPESFLDYSDNLIRDSEEDFDADGLPNQLEYYVRTNPHSSDSDHDGVSDSDEDHNKDYDKNGILDYDEYYVFLSIGKHLKLSKGYSDHTVLLNVEGTEDIQDMDSIEFYLDNEGMYLTTVTVTNQHFLKIRYQSLIHDRVANMLLNLGNIAWHNANYLNIFNEPQSPWSFANYSLTNYINNIDALPAFWTQPDPNLVVLPTIDYSEIGTGFEAESDTQIRRYLNYLLYVTDNELRERRRTALSLLHTGNDIGFEKTLENVYYERLLFYRLKALNMFNTNEHTRYYYSYNGRGFLFSYGDTVAPATWPSIIDLAKTEMIISSEENDYYSFANSYDYPPDLQEAFIEFANDVESGRNAPYDGYYLIGSPFNQDALPHYYSQSVFRYYLSAMEATMYTLESGKSTSLDLWLFWPLNF